MQITYQEVVRSGECLASQKDLEHCAACVCHVYSTVLPLFSGLPGAVAGVYTASSYYTQRNICPI